MILISANSNELVKELAYYFPLKVVEDPGLMSRFMNAPLEVHMGAMLRIFGYMKGHLGLGLSSIQLIKIRLHSISVMVLIGKNSTLMLLS